MCGFEAVSGQKHRDMFVLLAPSQLVAFGWIPDCQGFNLEHLAESGGCIRGGGATWR